MEENKLRLMTESLRLTHSDEAVTSYIAWIIKSDAAKQYWENNELPKLKIERCKIDLHEGYYYTAELIGIKGMVVSGDTKEKAIDELMTSIKIQLLYQYDSASAGNVEALLSGFEFENIKLEQMNNKELLIDFIKYAKSRHVMPILHLNIEPLVDDYLHQQNLQQCSVSGSLPCTHTYKTIYIGVGYVAQCTKCGFVRQ